MLLNQQHQSDVSGILPMPTDRIDDTSVVNTSTAEAVVWYYNDAGAWAAASGQAAGTMCVAKLTYSGVLNSNGSALGYKGDTSLSFAAATRAATLVRVPENEFSKMLEMTVAEKVAYIATWLVTNGDYTIDHRRSEVWLKTKADPTNDAATYKYATPLSGGGAGDSVNLIKVGGTAVTLGQKTSAASIPVVLPSDASANAGAASSGDATYMSPRDFAAAYTSATTLTLSGLPYTPNVAEFASVKKQDTTGVSKTYTPDVNAFAYNSGTGVLTVTGATFTATDVFVVTILGPQKMFTPATDSKRNEEISPMNQQVLEDSLADTTNVAASQQWYPSADGMQMSGFKNLSITGKYVDAHAVTTLIEVWGTNDEDVTAANRTWVRVTGYMAGCTGVGLSKDTYVDNITTTTAQTITYAWDFDNINYKYVRVGVLPGDATNTLECKARRTY